MQQMNKKPDDLKEGLARGGKGLVMVKPNVQLWFGIMLTSSDSVAGCVRWSHGYRAKTRRRSEREGNQRLLQGLVAFVFQL